MPLAKGIKSGLAELLKPKLERRVVKKSNGCLEWTGRVAGNGYPVIMIAGHNYSLRRLVYIANEKQPKLKTGDGVKCSCDNVRCVNPDHLVKGNKNNRKRKT